MKKVKLLRFSTLLAWLMTLVFAGLMFSKEKWSDSMIHSIKAGFHTGGTSPIIALQLADTLAELEGVLPETADGEMDREMAMFQVTADDAFIFAYTLLFVLLLLRNESAVSSWLLLALALGVGLCDVAENRILLSALQGMREATPEMIKSLGLLWWFAAGKWMSLFLLLTCLGYLELARTRTDVLPSVLRCLMGLLFLCGGLTGLAWGFGKNSGLLIENAMAFMSAALLLLPFLVWKPDAPWR